MSVDNLKEIYNGSFKRYLIISKNIGRDVLKHSELVNLTFHSLLQYIEITSSFKQPTGATEKEIFLKPLLQQVDAVKRFKSEHAASPFPCHIKVINETIGTFAWVTSENPVDFIDDMHNEVRFHTDKLLSELKEEDIHIEWVSSWLETLDELSSYVRKFYRRGLVWKGHNELPSSVLLGDIPFINRTYDHAALFKEISQGESIIRILKQVNDSNQEQKEPAEQTTSKKEEEIFIQDGKKWRIEHKKGDHKNLTIANAEKDNIVYIYSCIDCTVIVENKINVIRLDSCKKVSILCRSIISGVELIDCKNVKIFGYGVLPSVSIDSSQDVTIHITRKALDIKVFTCESSRINISYPFEDGYYRTFPIPTQLVTKIASNKLQTEVINES